MFLGVNDVLIVETSAFSSRWIFHKLNGPRFKIGNRCKNLQLTNCIVKQIVQARRYEKCANFSTRPTAEIEWK